MRDGAAVNGAASQSTKDTSIMFLSVFDIVCSSHSLENVGKHFVTPVLDEFMQGWVGLFARSPAARLVWKSRTGVPIKSCDNTRSWSQ